MLPVFSLAVEYPSFSAFLLLGEIKLNSVKKDKENKIYLFLCMVEGENLAKWL